MYKGIPKEVKSLQEVTITGNGREIIGNIVVNNISLRVKFIHPLKMACEEYTIAEIYRYPYETVFWKFSQNGFPKGCLCMLFYFKGDFIIGIIKGEQIFSVIPISSLVDRKRQLSSAALRCLKRIIANQKRLGIGHNLRIKGNHAGGGIAAI